MNYNENELKIKLLTELIEIQSAYKLDNIDHSEDVEIKFGKSTKYIVDLVVSLNDLELIFEINDSVNSRIFDRFNSLYERLYKNNRYFIIYTSEVVYLRTTKETFKPYDNLYQVFEKVTQEGKVNKEKIYQELKESEIYKSIFISATESFLISEDKIENLNKIYNLFGNEDFIRDIKIAKNGKRFYFTDDINDLENFENKFFNCLIEDLEKGQKFYRYGDSNLAYHTIKDKNFKFSGIPGMNDISEVGYVDKYLDNKYIPLTKNLEIRNINNKFILCSSLLKDNLNQWRLYGKDCQGTSVELEVSKKKNNFFIKKISYGQELDNKNYHWELELIKHLKDEFIRITNCELEFKTLEIWKHFFKSFEYQPEEEVRILYVNKDPHDKKIDWNLTHQHNILNPFLKFNLKDLPVKINKVYFGPKHSEVELNIKQFKYLSDLNGNSITFEKSRIKNFR